MGEGRNRARGFTREFPSVEETCWPALASLASPSRLKMRFRWRADNRQRTAYRISRSGICVPGEGGGGGGITYRRVQTKGRGEAAYIAKRSSLDLKYVAINGHNHYRFD